MTATRKPVDKPVEKSTDESAATPAVDAAEKAPPKAVDRRRLARYTVFGLTAFFLVLASAFAVGTVLEDPGGATAAVVILAWVLPAAALSVYAFLRPARAEQVLMVVTGVVVAFIVVQGLTDLVPTDDVGPVGTLAGLVVAVPLAFLGLHRAAMAGKLLLAVGLALAFSAFLGAPAGSATALAAPLLLFGMLFMVVAEPSGGRRRRPTPPTT
jgi:hypothetical protein